MANRPRYAAAYKLSGIVSMCVPPVYGSDMDIALTASGSSSINDSRAGGRAGVSEFFVVITRRKHFSANMTSSGEALGASGYKKYTYIRKVIIKIVKLFIYSCTMVDLYTPVLKLLLRSCRVKCALTFIVFCAHRIFALQ